MDTSYRRLSPAFLKQEAKDYEDPVAAFRNTIQGVFYNRQAETIVLAMVDEAETSINNSYRIDDFNVVDVMKTELKESIIHGFSILQKHSTDDISKKRHNPVINWIYSISNKKINEQIETNILKIHDELIEKKKGVEGFAKYNGKSDYKMILDNIVHLENINGNNVVDYKGENLYSLSEISSINNNYERLFHLFNKPDKVSDKEYKTLFCELITHGIIQIKPYNSQNKIVLGLLNHKDVKKIKQTLIENIPVEKLFFLNLFSPLKLSVEESELESDVSKKKWKEIDDKWVEISKKCFEQSASLEQKKESYKRFISVNPELIFEDFKILIEYILKQDKLEDQELIYEINQFRNKRWPHSILSCMMLNSMRIGQKKTYEKCQELGRLGINVKAWMVQYKGKLYNIRGDESFEPIFHKEYLKNIARSMWRLCTGVFGMKNFSYHELCSEAKEPNEERVKMAVRRLAAVMKEIDPKSVPFSYDSRTWSWNNCPDNDNHCAFISVKDVIKAINNLSSPVIPTNYL